MSGGGIRLATWHKHLHLLNSLPPVLWNILSHSLYLGPSSHTHPTNSCPPFKSQRHHHLLLEAFPEVPTWARCPWLPRRPGHPPLWPRAPWFPRPPPWPSGTFRGCVSQPRPWHIAGGPRCLLNVSGEGCRQTLEMRGLSPGPGSSFPRLRMGEPRFREELSPNPGVKPRALDPKGPGAQLLLPVLVTV